MRTRHLLAAALLGLPTVALAQPTPTPEPPPPPPTTQSLSPEEVRAIADEAAAAAVAAERARVAAERAEREAREGVPVAPPPETAEPAEDYTHGADGLVDGRLNFTLTDENLLAKPGETVPSVPGWRFGRPNSLGTLFFDNYDTRFSGYETLSNAIMYRNFRKDHLEVEGGFVMRINELAERKIDLSDAGSYVLVSWWTDPEHKNPERITLTAFPVSSDRMRLGYSYRLSWGGNEEYRRSSQAIPGFKLQYDTDKAYAFVGAKSSTLLDPETAEQVARIAFLGGAGVDLSEQLRFEMNGGYFPRGKNELQDVTSEEVQLYGVSAQIAAHQGMPVSSSIDYKLYKYDPERIGRFFQKAKYPGGTQWLAMAEATYLGQTLKDPARAGSTKVQSGIAGDINLRAMVERMRFRLDVQYRDLAFLLHSVPSLPTYQDFPSEYEITPNFFAAVGADQNFEDRLTLGVVVGMELPATLTSPTGVPGDTTMGSGTSTYVIRNNGGTTIINVLPPGEKAAASWAVKGTAQLDFAEAYAALLDVYYVYDPNQTRYRRSGPEEPFEYQFGEFNQLGVNLTLQAKF